MTANETPKQRPVRHHHSWELRTPVSDTSWMEEGQCRGLPAGAMTPDRYDDQGRLLPRKQYQAAVDKAKEICQSCPVIDECRRYGLIISAQVEDHSILGGLAPEERHELIGYEMRYRERHRRVQPCGTRAARMRHLRRGEPVCHQCAQRWAEIARVARQRRQDERGVG